MRQNEYCILNKQYTKDEFEKLSAKIAEHMVETGEFSKFFPANLRPFAYNESVANEFFPMKRTEVVAINWKWKDDVDSFAESVSDYKIADDIADVDDEILDKVLVCEVSGRPYKVVKQELDFYRKMKLPVSRLAPKERLSRRFQSKAQHKLFERKCSECGVGFSTVFDLKTADEIYCEPCYLKKVY